MSLLFTPGKIGTLTLQNRLVRSATAERMADADGRPLPKMKALYDELVRGGVGLIITGHIYVHPSGKCHPEMTGIYTDNLIPDLADLTRIVHQGGGKVAAQINHGGMQCSLETVSETIAPSAINAPFLEQPAREMTIDEIEAMIQAYRQAARRAQEAGFDAVQLHGAHGYLINQFLSPYVNRRTDEWGGDFQRRTRFLREVCRAVRKQVGDDYPVFIKFGMEDGVAGGLSAEEGAKVIALMKDIGLDGVEISGGVRGGRVPSIKKGIKSEEHEAYFLPLAKISRSVTDIPIILVGGMRSRNVMEQVLADGDADFISMSRPLICEPDLPNRMRSGVQARSRCISANNCWSENPGEGIACKCPL